MDIYQILEAIKGVEESGMAEADLLIQDIVNGRVDIYDVYAHPTDEVEKYVSGIIHKYYDEVVIDTGLHAKDDFEPIFDRVVDQLQQDYNVELDETFTGYWKGTDAGTPGKKMVGANEGTETDCDTTMSLEDRLRSRWEKTKREKGLQEYGMTTGGTQNPTAQDPADLAKQTTNVQQGVNKLKSAGVNIPSGSQAVQSLMKDPTKDPVSQLDKTVDAGLGQEVQNIVTKGQPNDVNQLAALIKKVNQQSGT
jgi:hypothetical protein